MNNTRSDLDIKVYDSNIAELWRKIRIPLGHLHGLLIEIPENAINLATESFRVWVGFQFFLLNLSLKTWFGTKD